MNAQLGAPSGDVTEVTHMVPSPGSGFVATHPAGNAGAVTESQVSRHGPLGLGDGLLTGVGLGLTPGEGDTPGVGETPGVGVGSGPLLARSYTSTRPFPTPLFFPASNVV